MSDPRGRLAAMSDNYRARITSQELNATDATVDREDAFMGIPGNLPTIGACCGIPPLLPQKSILESLISNKVDAERPMLAKLAEACDGLKALLLSKNESYSNGKGFTPVRMFSKADTVERINTRLDDKLARYVASGWSLELIDDFLGYLILQRIELVDRAAQSKTE